MGIKGIFIGLLITYFISVLILFIYHCRYLVLKFSYSEAKKMLHYGLPLIIVGTSVYIFNYCDRYLLKLFTDLQTVGLYTLGYQFAGVIALLLINPLKLIWGPMFLSVKDHTNATKYYSKMLTYVLFIGFILFLLLSLLSKEILFITVKEQYWEAYSIIPIITLTYCLWSSKTILNVGALLKRKTKVMAIFFTIGVVINVLFNMILIQKYGMIGAAYATLFSFLIMIVITYFYNQKLIHVQYKWKKIFKLCLVTAIIFFPCYLITIDNLIHSILFKLCLICTFPFILYLIHFYSNEEIRSIKRTANSIILKIKKQKK